MTEKSLFSPGGGFSSARVDELLYAEPYRFEFFQAVRLLEKLSPQRAPVGHDARPEDEVVRFVAHVSMTFPASELYDLTPPASGSGPSRMTVAFMGLAGSSGVLPRHYTELILERAKQKDSTLRDFLDLFNHRLISLFFRAAGKYRFWLDYERTEILARRVPDHPAARRSFVIQDRPRADIYSQCLLDLAGLGTPALRYRGTVLDELAPRMQIADETWRYFAGLLAQRHRSAAGLESMLNDYFGQSVRVIQFVGQWMPLDESSQTCLIPGGNTQLGRSAVAGTRVPELQSKFRMRIGALGYTDFLDFLPSGTAYRPLAEMVQVYAGKQYDVDVQLVLRAAEVPPCQLSTAPGQGMRLGWDTWAASLPFAQDVDTTVFALEN